MKENSCDFSVNVFFFLQSDIYKMTGLAEVIHSREFFLKVSTEN